MASIVVTWWTVAFWAVTPLGGGGTQLRCAQRIGGGGQLREWSMDKGNLSMINDWDRGGLFWSGQ